MQTGLEYGPPSVEKALGALPVVREILNRLGLAETVDELCPVRDIARITNGQVIEALVANRLTSPAPLLHVEDWARQWAVEEIFGIPADTLNDDRIGRALDAFAGQAEAVAGSVGTRTITAFGIDVSRIHWDMTSMSLFGAYPEADPDHPAPKYGHPKDRRTDLKQVQAGLGVTGDGGIPLLHRAYDGGAAEVSQVTGAMRALQKIAGERRFLLVGDAKLVSYTNLSELAEAEVTYIAPAPKSAVPAEALAAQDPTTATLADYTPARDEGKLFHQRGTYRVAEGTTTLHAPKKPKKDAGPPLVVRTVFVHSSAHAQADAATRAKRLDQARGDLDRLARGLGGRHYPDEQAAHARLAKISKERRVGAYLRAEAGTDPATGKPTLSWHFDQATLDTDAAADGWYALLTNLDPAEADAAEVLRRYKGQEVVERRYGDFKGPLAVAPLFLHDNQRIHALIHVICLALLVFSLVERAVRLAVAPAVKLAGLYFGNPAKPTGRLVFRALAGLRLVPAHNGNPAYIPRPSPLQQKLLDLLGVDPTRPP